MKEIMLQMAGYNVWANKLMIDALLQLSEEQLDRIIESSFPSIRKTVYHLWSAESIWQQRLNLEEKPVWQESVFEGSFQEATENWMTASKSLFDFTEKQFNDYAFTHVVHYYNLKKQSAKLQVYVALMQVLNHSTYHRGQLITMIRQAGLKKVPSTDFFLYAMKK